MAVSFSITGYRMEKIVLKEIWLSIGGFRMKALKTFDYWAGGLLAFVLPAAAPRPIREIQSLLVIRPGGIGDAVFLLPILKALRQKGVSIDVLCEPRNMQVFVSQAFQAYRYDHPGELSQVLKKRYDGVIDTEQWHYLSAIIAYFANTGYRAGFATRPGRAKLFNRQVAFGENEYEGNNFLRLFDGLWPETAAFDVNGCFEVPDNLKAWAMEQIPESSITVFLGASIALRRFTREQLKSIINGLLSGGFSPVLIGAGDVINMAQWVKKEWKDARLLDFTGKVSLVQSAALIQRSQKFIGPDSGLMHLACAVGTPVIAVFGPGNLQKWRPKGPGHKVVTKNVSCSPCTKFGYTLPTCRGSYHCVRDIKMENIISEI